MSVDQYPQSIALICHHLILDRQSIKPSVDTWSTLHWHLSWQSAKTQLPLISTAMLIAYWLRYWLRISMEHIDTQMQTPWLNMIWIHLHLNLHNHALEVKYYSSEKKCFFMNSLTSCSHKLYLISSGKTVPNSHRRPFILSILL